MIKIASEMSEAVNALRKFSDDIQQRIEIALDAAGGMIVEQFRADQLSGRRAPNYGLNKRTGNLYESLRNSTLQSGNRFTSEVYNRGAQYWYYHEFGTGFNPKRLWFEETFRKDGAEIYQTQLESALQGAV